MHTLRIQLVRCRFKKENKAKGKKKEQGVTYGRKKKPRTTLLGRSNQKERKEIWIKGTYMQFKEPARTEETESYWYCTYMQITKEEKQGQEDSDSKASRQPGLVDPDNFDDNSSSTRKHHRLQKITS